MSYNQDEKIKKRRNFVSVKNFLLTKRKCVLYNKQKHKLDNIISTNKKNDLILHKKTK